MSKRQRAIKLVEEMIELKAQIEQKEVELDALLGDGKAEEKGKEKGKSKAKSGPAGGAGFPNDVLPLKDMILRFMGKNQNRSVNATDVKKAIGCSAHAFGYHMKNLIKAKKVKRVKRGHYQLRGRKS